MIARLQKRLTGLHTLSVYVVVALAFLCVAFGGGVGPLMGIGFVAAMPISWWVDRQGYIDDSFAKWWNALIVGFIGLTIVQVAMTDEAIIDAAIRFVLLLTIVKLFGRFSHRDDLQLYALSFLIFAAATAVNEGVTYGILFGLYVIAGTFSLALFHLSSEVEDRRSSGPADRSPFDRRYMAVLGALSLVIFASSVIIFFVFPRVGLGFFVSKSRDEMNVTGFSESVELGSHGVVRDNPEVVMRVEFPDGRPNGYRTLPNRRGEFSVLKAKREFVPEISRHEPIQEVEIYLEPLGTNLLPRLWPTGQISFGNDEVHIPWSPNSADITIDAYGDVRHTMESDIGIAYSQTVLGKPVAAKLRAQSFDRGKMPRLLDMKYMQLPETSERFRELARQITTDAKTPYAKAEAVARHLQNSYEYTTNLPEVDKERPIESFLFDTQRGHCEYFATSAVLLLRAADVPARIVNGFLGGAWNNVGGYLGVRQGDAHSWIEVYVPNFGWAPLDPTPEADVMPVESDSSAQWWRDVYDAMRLNWMKWVIEYDLQSQIELFKKAGKYLTPSESMWEDNSDQGGSQDERGDFNVRPFLLWGGLLLGCVAGFGTSRRAWLDQHKVRVGLFFVAWPAVTALWMMWFRGFESHWGLAGASLGALGVAAGVVTALFEPQSAAARVQALFRRLEKAGKTRSVERSSDEGPGAYLERLGQNFPEAARDLRLFRGRYLAIRFGGRRITEEEASKLARLVRRIQKKMGERAA